MRAFLCLAAFVLFVSPQASHAYWGGGGDGGCCGLPPELEADAKLLRGDYQKLSFQELLDQQILGTLCVKNSCGGLNESQASLLLNRAIEDSREVLMQADRLEAKWTNRIGALTAISGLLVAAAGVYLSLLSLRVSREADRKSDKNEVEIAILKDSDNPSRGV